MFPKRIDAGAIGYRRHPGRAEHNKHWTADPQTRFGFDAEFEPEVPSGRSRAVTAKMGLPPTLLALPRVLFESEHGIPGGAVALQSADGGGSISGAELGRDAVGQPARPAQDRHRQWSQHPVAGLDLKREGAAEKMGLDYRSERYADWIAHVKTALPQVADIDVREREDDHHAYFVVSYRGGFKVPSSGLSDGTLRILTLTLLPYLRKQPAILVTEEPENGIHPRAIEAVLQSLSSLYDSQVWVSSHSPVVLAKARLDQILCGRLTDAGGVEMVAGSDHPRLREWRGGIDLGSLFAAGVLG